MGMIGIPIALFLLLMLLSPNVTFKNLISLMQQAVLPSILGWGMLLNMRCGNWDFACGSEALLAAIIGGNIAYRLGLGVAGIIICCMITGGLLGGLVGLLYYFTGVPTIIASLGIMFVYESLGSIVFEGKGINISSTKWVVMSNVTWGVLLAIVVGIFAHFVFYRTKFGYNVRAVGSSMAIAGNSGIKVPVVKALCLMLVGLFAGIYAAVNLCSVGVIRPVSAMGTMATCFDAMMCCFIGFSICFGRNQVISIFFGAFTMQILKLALLVFGFPTDYNSVVTAFFILIFIFISNNQDRFASIRKKAVQA